MRVAVVGVPKTIDNDILMMDKTFGFDTAVEEAQRAINSAYIEVKNSYIITSNIWQCEHLPLFLHVFPGTYLHMLNWYFPSILWQAHSAYHGIGIVKLMGRDSGFIAMHASLASGQIDICLIPEVFILDSIYVLFWLLNPC